MDLLRQYFNFIWSSYRKGFVLLLAASLGAGMTEGITLALLLPLLGVLGFGTGANILSQATQSFFSWVGIPLALEYVLLIIFVVSILQALIQYSRGSLQSWLQLRVTNDQRREILSFTLGSPWSRISRLGPATIASRLLFETERFSVSLNYFCQLISLSFLFLFYASIAASLHLPLTLGSLVLLMIGAYGLKRYFDFGRAVGAEITDRNKELYGLTTEILQSTKLIKAYNRESETVALYAQATDRNHRTWKKWYINTNKIRAFIEPTAILFLCCFLWISIRVLEIPSSTVLIMLFLFLRLVPRATALQQAWSDFLSQAPSYDSIQDLKRKLQDEAREPKRQGGVSPLDGSVAMTNVSYRAPDGADLLAGVNIIVAAGTCVGITGPSGAGKSTLIDLILGLIQITGGDLKMGRVGIEEISVSSWREQVGYVPQDSLILEGTFKENLMWGAPRATDEEIWDALYAVALADEVRAWPRGLESWLGAGGLRLSGGQKQRLSVARALLRHPKLLILDEATSQLDRENEKLLLQALQKLKGRVTLLLVAHRLATLQLADQIILLEKGRVIESGTPRELLAEGSRFSSLFEGER